MEYRTVNNTTNWYDVTRINEYSYRIMEAGVYGMYLLVGSEEALIIDAGAGVGDLRSLVDEYTDQPLKLLVTHSHWDHMGAVNQFDTVLVDEREVDPEGRIAINGLSDEFTQRPQQFVGRWRNEGNEFPDAFDSDSYNIPPSQPGAVEFIEPGDVINLGDLVLETFDFCGHSPGQMGVLDVETDILYGSDVIHNEHDLYIHFRHCDIHEYVESFDRLVALYEDDRFDTLMTSHNEPFEGEEMADIIYRLRDGLWDIVAGDAEYDLVNTEWGEAKQYTFDGSKVMVDPDFEYSES